MKRRIAFVKCCGCGRFALRVLCTWDPSGWLCIRCRMGLRCPHCETDAHAEADCHAPITVFRRALWTAIEDASKAGISPPRVVRELFDTAITATYVATGSPKDHATHSRISYELGAILARRATSLFSTIRAGSGALVLSRDCMECGGKKGGKGSPYCTGCHTAYVREERAR